LREWRAVCGVQPVSSRSGPPEGSCLRTAAQRLAPLGSSSSVRRALVRRRSAERVVEHLVSEKRVAESLVDRAQRVSSGGRVDSAPPQPNDLGSKSSAFRMLALPVARMTNSPLRSA